MESLHRWAAREPLQTAVVSALFYRFLLWVLSSMSRYLPSWSSFSKEDQTEYLIRLVSTLHALIATTGAILWIQQEGIFNSKEQLASEASPILMFFLSSTLGYLWYDLFQCLSEDASDTAMLVHHAVIIFAFSLGLVYRFGLFFMGIFLVNEITTPFLNIRWLLLKCGMREHKLYLINGYAFGITFSISRVFLNICMAGFMTFKLCLHHVEYFQLPFPMGLLCGLPLLAWVHVFVNLHWFIKIVKMLQRYYKLGKDE